jgi:hypothetical protein
LIRPNGPGSEDVLGAGVKIARVMAGLMMDRQLLSIIVQAKRAAVARRPSHPLRLVLGRVLCVCFEVQTGKHLLDVNITAFDPKQKCSA